MEKIKQAANTVQKKLMKKERGNYSSTTTSIY